MKSELKIAATTRQPGQTALKQLRSQGFIPVVVYGPKTDNLHLQVKKIDALKLYTEAGSSSLIILDIDGKDQRQVLIKDIARTKVKDQLMHIDFFQVDMAEKVTAEVALNFVGDAPAVKQLGGVVVRNFDTVEVECLPKNLVGEIEVDLSSLVDFSANIIFADLQLPKGIVLTSKHELTDVIVAVEEPRAVAAAEEVEEVVAETKELNHQASSKEKSEEDK